MTNLVDFIARAILREMHASVVGASREQAREAANAWLCGSKNWESAGLKGVDEFRTHNLWKLLDHDP